MSRGQKWLLAAALAALGVSLLAPTEADPDLWGHLFYGRDIWSRKALPETNTYSYTAPMYPWINHEWLFESGMYVAHSSYGQSGLVLFKGLWLVIILACLWTEAARRRAHILGAILLWVALVPKLYCGMQLRPQLATYALSAVFLVTLGATPSPYPVPQGERGNNGKHRRVALSRWVWLLPLVMALWANLHGGFVVGLAILALFLMYQVARLRLRRAGPSEYRSSVLPAAVLLLLAALATLVNPYGLGLWKYLANALLLPRPQIEEWQSALAHCREPHVIGFFLIVVFWLLATACYKGRHFGFYSLAFVVFACASFLHIRHIPLAVLAGILALSAPVQELVERTLQTSKPRRTAALLWAVALILAALPIARGVAALWTHGLRVVERGDEYPGAAVQFMKQTMVRGNMVCYFDWAQYALWHLHPRVRPSFDGRFETAYPREVAEAHFAFHAGAPGWRAVLDRYPTTVVLMPAGSRVCAWLAVDEDWLQVYADAQARIFVRKRDERALFLEPVRPGGITPRPPTEPQPRSDSGK